MNEHQPAISNYLERLDRQDVNDRDSWKRRIDPLSINLKTRRRPVGNLAMPTDMNTLHHHYHYAPVKVLTADEYAALS